MLAKLYQGFYFTHPVYNTFYTWSYVSQPLGISNGLVVGYFNPNAPLEEEVWLEEGVYACMSMNVSVRVCACACVFETRASGHFGQTF